MTKQGTNIAAASVGAASGLGLQAHLPSQTSPVLLALAAAALIFYLGKDLSSRSVTLALCGLLGILCTAMTIALMS